MTKTIPLPFSPVCSFRDSSDQSEDWRKPSSTFDIEQCGRRGSASIQIRVKGYWSDVITLRIDRGMSWRDESTAGQWSCSLSHSAGGRMTTTDDKHYPPEYFTSIADDLEAEENFGKALIEASRLGREILNHSAALEAFYQQRRAEQRMEEEREAAEQQARIDSDVPMGEAAAKQMIEQAKQIGMWSERKIEVFARGAEHPTWLLIKRSQAYSIMHMGSRIAQAAAIALLAESSKRTHIIDPQ